MDFPRRTNDGARGRRWRCSGLWAWAIGFTLALLATGCASAARYFQNGGKLGPNHCPPPAPAPAAWLDARQPQVVSAPADWSVWWRVFNDPVLNDLIQIAYAQNVNLRIASTRVLEAQAQRGIAAGTLFPQQQTVDGGVQRIETSGTVAYVFPPRCYNNSALGFGASWELDFWGRIRRTIEAADAGVDAAVDDYDNVMVTLVADVAATYVQLRTLQQQLAYARQNIELQRGSLKIAADQFRVGQTDDFSVAQATALLAQMEATVPALELGLREANNRLCFLLGLPPTALVPRLGPRPIPAAPQEVVVGIPADLLRRRPDLRAAERRLAAQNARIGIAESDWYPAFSLTGSLGYQAMDLGELLTARSFNGQLGPGFQWNILNYGRIAHNVNLQHFKTQELVDVYQQKVLAAAQEAENGIVKYLNAQVAATHLARSVGAAERAAILARLQFANGVISYTPVLVAEQFLTRQQTLLAQAEGDIALGLIAVYRAIGGGWQVHLADHAPAGPPVASAAPEPVPPPTRLPAP